MFTIFFTTLSQQILSDKLLLVVSSKQKYNFKCVFKLEQIAKMYIFLLIQIHLKKIEAITLAKNCCNYVTNIDDNPIKRI